MFPLLLEELKCLQNVCYYIFCKEEKGNYCEEVWQIQKRIFRVYNKPSLTKLE